MNQAAHNSSKETESVDVCLLEGSVKDLRDFKKKKKTYHNCWGI